MLEYMKLKINHYTSGRKIFDAYVNDGIVSYIYYEWEGIYGIPSEEIRVSRETGDLWLSKLEDLHIEL